MLLGNKDIAKQSEKKPCPLLAMSLPVKPFSPCYLSFKLFITPHDYNIAVQVNYEKMSKIFYCIVNCFAFPHSDETLCAWVYIVYFQQSNGCAKELI